MSEHVAMKCIGRADGSRSLQCRIIASYGLYSTDSQLLPFSARSDHAGSTTEGCLGLHTSTDAYTRLVFA